MTVDRQRAIHIARLLCTVCHRFLFRPRLCSCHDLTKRQSQRNSQAIEGPLQANNGDAVRDAVRAGVGMAILPDFLIDEDLRAQRVVPLLPEFDLPHPGIYAVYPPTQYMSAKARKFIDFLVDRFAAQPAWRKGSPEKG
ncbi:MAG: LysR substrate-binding domain-containing protein, partial [Magnetococcus sp. XQGC-1]